MTSTTDTALSEDAIADYLLHQPEFFERHAELLRGVQLTSGHGPRAVSLQERQAEMLREKIKGLEHRIIDMMRHGSENTATAAKIHQWTCAMARVQDLRELPHVVTAGLQHIFDVPQVALRLWNVGAAYGGSVYTMGVSDDARSFAASLTAPYCGENLGFETARWLHKPEAAQSLALLTLRDGDAQDPATAFGMLVLGSPDISRFDADMGTEFLQRITELASASLSRLRAVPLRAAV
jgi:uncharacterized protein YigA (DUF484 family)